jgi:hypothetical protein
METVYIKSEPAGKVYCGNIKKKDVELLFGDKFENKAEMKNPLKGWY